MRLGGDDAPKCLYGNDEDLARFSHSGGHEHPRATQEVQLTEKPSRAMGDDEPILAIISDDDLDQTREHDVEVVGGIPLAVEVLTSLDASASAEGCQNSQLRRVESRNQLRVDHRGRSVWRRRICRFLTVRASTRVQSQPW